MTIWIPDLTAYQGPRYRALAQAITDAVSAGELPPGHRLPPQRDLAFRLGVTVGTVTRAYALAEQQGLVQGEVGRGTFVRSGAEDSGFVNLVVDGSGNEIKLTVNSQPDDHAKTLLGQALARLAQQPGIGGLLDYTPRVGLPAHRSSAARWAGRVGFTAVPATTLITAGAHQAIAVALAAFATAGDTVLTEALVYSGINHIAARFGIRLHGLALDAEGIVPDALEEACRQGGARMLLLNPTNHNPTTATMSEARRQEIVSIARRHDLIIVEDDVYGRLPEDRPPPFAKLAPERTIYITSASKTVAPGLRFGVLVAPPDLFDRLADIQVDLFLMCPALSAAVFHLWLEDGTADELAGRQRAEAIARQEIAGELLHGIEYQAAPTSYHLWLPLAAPWRSTAFVEAVKAEGVLIDPAFLFAVNRPSEPHAARISLSAAASHERLRQALVIIRRTLEAGPVRRRDSI
jgi:DNA-binding transcriptional MocR family regulator